MTRYLLHGTHPSSGCVWTMEFSSAALRAFAMIALAAHPVVLTVEDRI